MKTIVKNKQKKKKVIPAVHYQEEKATVSPGRYTGRCDGKDRNPNQVNPELSKAAVI